MREEKPKEVGLTERIIMSMASEMADMKRTTERTCVLFQALAEAAGVNVANAFAE